MLLQGKILDAPHHGRQSEKRKQGVYDNGHGGFRCAYLMAFAHHIGHGGGRHGSNNRPRSKSRPRASGEGKHEEGNSGLYPKLGNAHEGKSGKRKTSQAGALAELSGKDHTHAEKGTGGSCGSQHAGHFQQRGGRGQPADAYEDTGQRGDEHGVAQESQHLTAEDPATGRGKHVEPGICRQQNNRVEQNTEHGRYGRFIIAGKGHENEGDTEEGRVGKGSGKRTQGGCRMIFTKTLRKKSVGKQIAEGGSQKGAPHKDAGGIPFGEGAHLCKKQGGQAHPVNELVEAGRHSGCKKTPPFGKKAEEHDAENDREGGYDTGHVFSQKMFSDM